MTQSPATPLPTPKERRRLREAKSLTQDQVAARLGVTRETVRSWETGRTAPRGRKRQAYAKLLAEPACERAERTEQSAAPAGPTERAPQPARTARSAARPSHPTGPTSPPNPGNAKKPRKRAHPAPVTGNAAPPSSPAPAPAPASRSTPSSRSKSSSGSGSTPTPALTPAQAFDALYTRTAPYLVRQTYLLTGRRTLARESVERAFQQAWQRWPEVAVDPDPAGWVRAAAHEYAMSPWHRLRPGNRHPEAPPAAPEDRRLLDALLSLPPAYRRTLLLYDGVGLDLPETAAETEASTPATANRIMHARKAVAEHLPDLSAPEVLHRRLAELAGSEKLDAPGSAHVRSGGERRTRLWTRTAVAATALIVGATALTIRVAPTHYEPTPAPGTPITGVPPLTGPGPLTKGRRHLRDQLRHQLSGGPERLAPTAE
ncbi:sigma factor-like helix-turn-helix DNA-binding protein [Streptomyces beihaiensis]|uniref:Helix-turn-helix domain-containing protein n=1 Tax=Streptomyces beihaiensis TaxID=2984495 RepID=A0ABT3TMU2_9ACTN|nr:sigma factor-like helix-turn-helix DNA-binding protein [Streptomyces beihaiensis]MCX3058341.1 helix-turn-helix domain-containing protein [Streptomyces beihaiensis]